MPTKKIKKFRKQKKITEKSVFDATISDIVVAGIAASGLSSIFGDDVEEENEDTIFSDEDDGFGGGETYSSGSEEDW